MLSNANTVDPGAAVWRGLAHARRRGRLGHAYLLVGDDIETLCHAALFAVRLIACPSPRDDGTPCDACPTCTQVTEQTHPDVHIIRPSTKTRQIPIDAVRDLEARLRLASAEGQYRFGVIIEADQMNPAAQNAFLKTLEEPPSRCILLLATTKAQRLLPTIRSRCQRLNLFGNRPSYEAAVRAGVFAAVAGLRPGAGAAVGLAAARRLLDVLGALEKEAAERTADQPLDADWETLAKEDDAVRKRLEEEKKLRMAAEYARLRQVVLEGILTWYRQIEILSSGGAWEDLPAPEMFDAAGLSRDRVEQMAGEIPPDAAERASRLAERFISDLSANVQETLAVYTFCLGVCRAS